MNLRLAEYHERRKHEAAKKRTQKDLRSIPRKLRDLIQARACRVCEAPPASECHHIVPRSKFGRWDQSCHDPANLIPLCHQCHQDHHTTAHKRIPRSKLYTYEIEYATKHCGEAWISKWYPV